MKGTVLVVNGTDLSWQKQQSKSYQMSWPFPETIEAHSMVAVNIDFQEKMFKNERDDSAYVQYRLWQGSKPFDLRIKAHWHYVQFKVEGVTGIEASFNNIGFQDGKYVTIALVGDEAHGFAANVETPDAAATWMSDSLAMIGHLRLRDICLPGSHDAGMSPPIHGHTAGVSDHQIITQAHPVGVQLGLGARYFDIRPVVHGGHFYAGHYTGSRGGNGQSLEDIILQVNQFSAGKKELIVLDISHTKDTDNGYKDLSPTQWEQLYNQLSGLSNLFVRAPDKLYNMAELTINEFLQARGSAVIVLSSDSNVPDRLLGRGFFNKNQSLPIFNEYSGTNNLNKMIDNQVQKMREHTHAGAPWYFLISWTLTQSTTDAILPGAPSVVTYAKVANGALGRLVPYVVPGPVPPEGPDRAWPSILFTDYIVNTTSATLARYFNMLAARKRPPTQAVVGVSKPGFVCCA